MIAASSPFCLTLAMPGQVQTTTLENLVLMICIYYIISRATNWFHVEHALFISNNIIIIIFLSSQCCVGCHRMNLQFLQSQSKMRDWEKNAHSLRANIRGSACASSLL
jgi:hypothetical protein